MPIYALNTPVYEPAMRQVIAISQAELASVTTSFPHTYVDGTIVRFYIPESWGMPQMNQQFGAIIVTGPATFLVSIDTRTFEPFIVPLIQIEIAQVVPIGSQPYTYEPALHNVLI